MGRVQGQQEGQWERQGRGPHPILSTTEATSRVSARFRGTIPFLLKPSVWVSWAKRNAALVAAPLGTSSGFARGCAGRKREPGSVVRRGVGKLAQVGGGGTRVREGVGREWKLRLRRVKGGRASGPPHPTLTTGPWLRDPFTP